jgi:hypothetical protein
MSNSFRPYEKLKGKRTYWNLRVTPKLKKRAQLIAYQLGVSPAKVARDGIETEVSRLEEELKRAGNGIDEKAPNKGNGSSL